MFIGIAGSAGSGKDTVADLLVFHGVVDSKYNFADPIKSILKHGFGLTDEQLNGKLKETKFVLKKSNCKPAFFYQWLAKANIFDDEPNYILNEFIYQLYNTQSKFNQYVYRDTESILTTPRIMMQTLGTDVVRNMISPTAWLDCAPITDNVNCSIRFSNEADLVLNNNGLLIKVTNSRIIPGKHKSDSLEFLKDVDHTIINNNSSLSVLESSVLELFNIKTNKRLYND